jgi:hypothetical protein
MVSGALSSCPLPGVRLSTPTTREPTLRRPHGAASRPSMSSRARSASPLHNPLQAKTAPAVLPALHRHTRHPHQEGTGELSLRSTPRVSAMLPTAREFSLPHPLGVTSGPLIMEAGFRFPGRSVRPARDMGGLTLTRRQRVVPLMMWAGSRYSLNVRERGGSLPQRSRSSATRARYAGCGGQRNGSSSPAMRPHERHQPVRPALRRRASRPARDVGGLPLLGLPGRPSRHPGGLAFRSAVGRRLTAACELAFFLLRDASTRLRPPVRWVLPTAPHGRARGAPSRSFTPFGEPQEASPQRSFSIYRTSRCPLISEG